MSQKIRRRDLKRNELAETMGKTVGYVTEHRRGVTEAVAIAAVAVLVGGFFVYRAWTERAAGKRCPRPCRPRHAAGLRADAAGAPKTYPTAPSAGRGRTSSSRRRRPMARRSPAAPRR